MFHKRLQLSPGVRMALAFGLFGTLVASGMLAVFGLPQRGKTAAHHKAPQRDADELDDGSFFYQSIGHTGTPSDDTQSATTAMPETKEKTLYTLEIKVSDRREEAESLVATLHDQGIDAYYTPLSHAGRVVYRVRQGMFNDTNAAKNAALALRQQRNVTATIVKLQ